MSDTLLKGKYRVTQDPEERVFLSSLVSKMTDAERSPWTVSMIAEQMTTLNCVDTVGKKTVRVALKKMGIAPWVVSFD